MKKVQLLFFVFLFLFKMNVALTMDNAFDVKLILPRIISRNCWDELRIMRNSISNRNRKIDAIIRSRNKYARLDNLVGEAALSALIFPITPTISSLLLGSLAVRHFYHAVLEPTRLRWHESRLQLLEKYAKNLQCECEDKEHEAIMKSYMKSFPFFAPRRG